jgi:ABC-type uncharacterized transport system YnjBCD ATPase subunit
VIEIENLTKKFGDVTAVDGLTLTIGEGEVFGLLGPNGAGNPVTELRRSFRWGAGALPRWVCRTTRRILVCQDPLQ